MATHATLPENAATIITVDVVTDEHGQTIHLPPEYHIEATQVTVQRSGTNLLLQPMTDQRRRTPEEFLAWWTKFQAEIADDEPFPEPGEPGPAEVRDFQGVFD